MIPRTILASLTAYIERGEAPDPGSCVHAILSNDLARAVCLADDETYPALREIIQLLYTWAPGTCKGTEDAAHVWCMRPQSYRDRLALHGDWPDRPEEYRLSGSSIDPSHPSDMSDPSSAPEVTQ